ncbi:universal stress protein [Halostagnicola kamekurae]|uniref:Nucleotide-binding universal stress protein, UspA family n=1 Tax=Halostagnicola kamekurae TaxID=619731 RepID=A0A1I6PMT8_9EURY|nr:universal stress protein [Halostagnicola kamekurae]SFS41537.1 Nucleotide-binding universal stress protein, UspA family [Halostagnicola kamekurae]
MTMYDRILVAIDDSDHAATALAHAIDLATSVDATVFALTVVEPSSPLSFGVEEVDELNEAASRLVEETREAAAGADDLEVRVDVLRGEPSDAILEYAAEIDAELLVVGQGSADGIAETLLGSTAERLSQRTTTPMTIVPPPESKGE